MLVVCGFSCVVVHVLGYSHANFGMLQHVQSDGPSSLCKNCRPSFKKKKLNSREAVTFFTNLLMLVCMFFTRFEKYDNSLL